MARTPCRILHFEDDEVDAELVRRTLARDGEGRAQLVQVGDLASGLAHLESEAFDVVLLDLSLPDALGARTYDAVRNATEAVPVVIMTGHEDGDLAATLVQRGAQDYLLKSQVRDGVLWRAVRHAIERHRGESKLREARRAALEAARAKTEFLYSMSHEIRTPLNSILGMADLLLETDVDAEQERYVKVFRSAGEMLLDLIGGILDLSAAEAGALQMDLQPFEPRTLLESTLEVLAFSAHRKGLTLACEVGDDVPRRVGGDARRLRQVLINLIGNSIKFTERGEVVVELRAPPDGESADSLHFSIRDTGIGIPPEQVGRIFERFAQGDGTITRRYGGTGLGLSLCSELVRLLGGRLWVESEAGRGSTFHFTAHLAAVEEGAAEVRPRAAAGALGRVLVADDVETERRLLAGLLERNGYAVRGAAGGEEALAALEEAESRGEPFDAVLVDCRMPEPSGFTIARRMDAVWRGRTVMMLTADHRTGDVQECDRLALGGWLVKPWRAQALLEQVEEVVAGRARPARESAAGPARARGPEIGPLAVLLADDSEDNRALVRAYLKGTPVTLDEAADGSEALKRFQAGAYDLVLMDMQMPRTDGYAATRAIRSMEASGGRARIPVLALTAYAFPEERRRSLEAGCDAHLTKPIRKGDLLAAIAAHAAPAPAAERIPVEIDEDLAELVEGFLENRHGDVARLDEALEGGDFETVRVLGHNMKGVGRSYGFDAISEIGLALEAAGVAGRREEAAKQTRILEDYLDRVQVQRPGA